MRRVVVAVVAVVLVVGAGCSTAVDAPESGTSGEDVDDAGPADPETDVLGWENGYWHNESIDVDQSDGLSDAELDAYVGRAMARVEYIRDREFSATVPVDAISRSEYANQSGGNTSEAYAAWNNQVWEALFVVGEEADAQDKLSSTLGQSVAGFYSPSADEIKIVTPTPSEPTINNATLVHELTHALQDQQFDLTSERFGATTQDGDLATDGLIEGDARYVERQYVQRCGDEWSCVTPSTGESSGTSQPPSNWGILLTIYQPYSDGPVYVDSLIESGGWDAVADRYENPPVSTEQIIHRTDERPVPIEFDDRARNGWSLFSDVGQNGSDTVGEASMYVSMWYQSREYGADAVDWPRIADVDSELDVYDYRSAPSEGWANDRVFPYRRDGEYGYVWKTRWDTGDDAEEFYDAYMQILEAHDAEQSAGSTWVVPEGPYADAFRVVRNGTTVTVVNGPTADALDDIRPPADADAGTGTTARPGDADTRTADGDATRDETASGGQPGFGVGHAVAAAVVATAVVAARVRAAER